MRDGAFFADSASRRDLRSFLETQATDMLLDGIVLSTFCIPKNETEIEHVECALRYSALNLGQNRPRAAHNNAHSQGVYHGIFFDSLVDNVEKPLYSEFQVTRASVEAARWI